MTTLIQNKDVRTISLGLFSQGSAKTVPQNATQTVFTVTGGRIAIVALTGVVTTIIGGTTPSAKYVSTPTTGTATDLCTATAITSAEVGAQMAIPGPIGSALNIGTTKTSGAVTGQTAPVIVPAGTLGFNVSAADATGAVQHTLVYVPLDAGAQVTAN